MMVCPERVIRFMRNFILIVSISACFALSSLNLQGQINTVKYWIAFTDKNNNPFKIEKPEEYLSERALLRRQNQSIQISESDLPVNPSYIDSLRQMGFKIINTSRWLNGVIVSADSNVELGKLDNIDFIKLPIIQVSCKNSSHQHFQGFKESITGPNEVPDYGQSDNQIKMLNGDYLHRQGFEGEKRIIAIEDAGFTNANSISSLFNLWMANRVVVMKDFVKDSLSLLDANSHGTIVLSILAGVIPQVLYGTATQANYALLRTEDGCSECIIEEYNWACGAEFADSLGADVINSSLGYSVFDDSTQNHYYKDMDGKTTPAAIAAGIAASKGMLVVVSAGNEGSNGWYRITTPADAINVLTVGAVDQTETITKFSSRGPSFDKRIKPDVCARGLATVAQSESDMVINVSGTSCSAPLISGLATCLWEANPKSTCRQILEAIQESSSQYDHPDSLYGYGIPDFLKADRILKYNIKPAEAISVHFSLFPNPATDHFYLEVIRPQNSMPESVTIYFLDIMGKILNIEKRNLEEPYSILEFQGFEYYSTGIYTLRIEFQDQLYSVLFMKSK
jgi:serine protease AprX